MAFIASTEGDVREMLAAIGVGDIEALFADVPDSLRLKAPPEGLPPALSEYEMLRLMRQRAAENRPAAGGYVSFLGGGAYEHFIPAAVHALAQRGEILTAYTPYQPEASQGTLQIIYEFQSMVGALTELPVANASLYDGASALAEAVLMAMRVTGRRQVVLPATLHPNYRQVVESYTGRLDVELSTWPADPAQGGARLDLAAWPTEVRDPAAVVVAQPNFFGYLEEAREIAAQARERGALVLAVANPMSLSVLEPPGAWGADIAVGECQPIGLPLHFGGPYAGYMACRREFIRKMPGRIVGRTTDALGRTAFVLTLQTREQHIRRERATSNICTNQGLCAAMVTFWLALIGKAGFVQLGRLNLDSAGRLAAALSALPGVELLCAAPFFNEFTLRLPMPAESFYEALRERGVLPGLPLSRLGPYAPDLLLVCATETKLPADLDAYVAAARELLNRTHPG